MTMVLQVRTVLKSTLRAEPLVTFCPTAVPHACHPIPTHTLHSLFSVLFFLGCFLFCFVFINRQIRQLTIDMLSQFAFYIRNDILETTFYQFINIFLINCITSVQYSIYSIIYPTTLLYVETYNTSKILQCIQCSNE